MPEEYRPYPETPIDDTIFPELINDVLTIEITVENVPTPPNTAISPPFKIDKGIFQIFCRTLRIRPIDRFRSDYQDRWKDEWVAHWYTEAYYYAKWQLITGAQDVLIPFPLPIGFRSLFIPYWSFYPGNLTPIDLLPGEAEGGFIRHTTPGFGDFATNERAESDFSFSGINYHIIVHIPQAEKHHPTVVIGTNWTQTNVIFPNPYFPEPSKIYGSWTYPTAKLEFRTESWKDITSIYVVQWIGTGGIAPIVGALLSFTPFLFSSDDAGAAGRWFRKQ